MAIINVPGDFSTIQDAVTSASEGDVILVENGTYPEQVSIGNSNDRIRIVANGKNVILDGAVGSLGVAFELSDVTGVEIKGFTIQNYNVGISVGVGGSFNRIIRNKIMDVIDGIDIFFSSNGNLIWKNEFKGTGTGTGITLAVAFNNWIVENIVHGYRTGVLLSSTVENNALIGNQSFNNIEFGFEIDDAPNTLVLRNEVFKNGNNGITIFSSPNSVLLNNKIKYNDGDGLFLSDSGNCIVSKNEIKKNDRNGITTSSDFSIIQENKIKKNKENGINLATGASKNTVIRNCIERNKVDGINIDENATENNIVQNKVCDNKVLDIDENSLPQDNEFADNKCENSDPSEICTGGCHHRHKHCCCEHCDDD